MLTDLPDAVIYCESPYPTSDIEPYGVTTDYAELTEALLSQAGSVAVSGYGGTNGNTWAGSAMRKSPGLPDGANTRVRAAEGGGAVDQL